MFRLLSIDDDASITELVCQLGREAGFKTRSCAGKAAFAAYDHFKPDIVVLDIVMPEIDGFEMLQHLKNRDSQSRIVILSGSGMTFRRMAKSLAEGLKLTLAATLTKPFSPIALLDILERLHLELEQGFALPLGHCSGDSFPRMNSN